MSAGDVERLAEFWWGSAFQTGTEFASELLASDWLAAHDAGVAAAARREGAAEALREAAELADRGVITGKETTRPRNVALWLRARADRVAAAPHEEQP